MYTIEIVRKADGEKALYTVDDEFPFSFFQWTDGNYGCDCNRYLFFKRSRGEEIVEDDVECGDMIAFDAYYILPSGERVLLDPEKYDARLPVEEEWKE